MKKITLFAMMALFCFGLSAQTLNRKTDVQLVRKLSAYSPNHVAKADNTDVIEEEPAGEKVRYIRSGTSYEQDQSYGTIDTKDQYGPIYFVFAEDGSTVYIQNPIARFIVGSWVKATKEGNKITLPLNQNLMYHTYYSTYIKLGVLKDDGAGSYNLDTSIENVTYTINEETISLDALPEGYVLGSYWADDNKWASYGDVNSVYTVSKDMPPVAPEGVELKDYVMNAERIIFMGSITDAKVKVGVKDNEVYIQGLCVDMPELWAKGIKEGRTVTFPAAQWMGDTKTGDAIYLFSVDDEDNAIEVVYDYDEATDVYKQTSEFVLFCVAPDEIKFITAYESSELTGVTNSIDAVAGAQQTGVTVYYDMQGRRVVTPVAGGIYVKTTTFADGSKNSEKLVVR
ncbi:MAG: hypothetical protein SPI30_06915 [Prevotella sp.]|nr:hypothetical protein [Prevotella sp.]